MQHSQSSRTLFSILLLGIRFFIVGLSRLAICPRFVSESIPPLYTHKVVWAKHEYKTIPYIELLAAKWGKDVLLKLQIIGDDDKFKTEEVGMSLATWCCEKKGGKSFSGTSLSLMLGNS
jgi:hypothetical protein